ncbi:MAG: cytochrome P460 family protein [Longimicrobiales bacterium]
MKHRWLILILAVAFPVTACDAGQDTDSEMPGGETMPESEQQESMPESEQQMMTLPDTTAQAVWSYLQDADYQDWRMWPGKGELYEGTEPHGMLLTTYLNGTAYDGLTTGSGELPNGSIVVKENYMPDSTLAAITVMYSAEGYDAEHNDYFWAKYEADGTVEDAGRVESCTNCHTDGERGYLMTPYEGGM